MLKVKYRKEKRSSAQNKLDELIKHKTYVLIVHYSCESFFDIPQGKTPRITSIAVRYFNSGQTSSFSIHKVAEKRGIILEQIEDKYDELEKEMLYDFYHFLEKHNQYFWIHWNMRDINYGFEAINHRYSVLGGKPTEIDDTKRVDLSRLLIDKYGDDYIDHSRLYNLCVENNITLAGFLKGKEEAEAFINQEYVKLHQSTLRKVDALDSILDKAVDDSLKNKSNIFKIYGCTPQGLYEISKENWLMALSFAILGIILGIILTKILN